jgi:hypothetical protein
VVRAKKSNKDGEINPIRIEIAIQQGWSIQSNRDGEANPIRGMGINGTNRDGNGPRLTMRGWDLYTFKER